MKKYFWYTILTIWILGVLAVGGRLGEPLLKSFFKLVFSVDVECEYRGRTIEYCYSLGKDIAAVEYLPHLIFWLFIGLPVILLFWVLWVGERRLKKKEIEKKTLERNI